jgi:beta-glucosidase
MGWMYGRCIGNIPPIDDFPGLCVEVSPLGVRSADFVTVFPAAINAAST